MSNKEKYNKVFGEMVLKLEATNERELFYLGMAIDYEGLYNYTEEPKSFEEQGKNSIFKIRVTGYYERKLIEFRTDIPDLPKKLHYIREREERDVKMIQMRFIPPPITMKDFIK